MIGAVKQRFARRCFLLCWFGYTLAYVCRMNYSMAMPFISGDIPRLAERTGWIGSCFFFSYACGQLLWGRLGDYMHPGRMILAGLSLSAFANVCFGLMGGATGMALCWALNGFFQSMLWGPILRIVSSLYDARVYNRISPLLMLSTVFGYLAAWGLSGLLSSFFHWRFAFFVPGALLGLFSLVWLFALLREKNFLIAGWREKGGRGDRPQDADRLPMRTLLARARLVPVLFAAFCQGMVKDGISLWAPLYFLLKFGLSFSSTIGFILLIPFFNALGVCFAGFVNLLTGFRERRSAALLFSLTFLLLCLVTLMPRLPIAGASVLVAAASGMSHGTNSILLSYLPLKCAAYGRSSTVAGLMDFCSYFGVSVSSVAVGVIVARGYVSLIPASWLLAAACGMLFMLLSQGKREVTQAC